jgi:hypothetical protein
MGEKKQIAYYYDRKINNEDTQVDLDGDKLVPERGQIIEKHGGQWKVEMVITEYGFDGSLTVYKVYLVKA